MDKLVSLLTTTDGRIGRQQWWIGSITLSILAFIPNVILMFAFIERAPVVFVLGSFLVTLVVLWSAYCIGIKRRRDRGSSGIDIKLLLAGALLGQLIQIPRMLEVLSGNPGAELAPALWMQIIGFAWSLFGLYVFIQLGFLKGTTGPNTYGADPLNAA